MPTIDYEDIKDAAQVVHDNDPVNPFEDDDYMDHSQRRYYDDEERESRAYCNPRGRDRFIIDLKEFGGEYKYARENGASKQVAAEYAACVKRQRLEAIKKVYEYGYESYGVCIEVNAGGKPPAYADKAEDNTDPDSPWYGAPDISESYWGFGLEAAQTEGVNEVADLVAAILEEEGWEVTNKPNHHQTNLKNKQEYIRYKISMFTWKD